MHNISLIERFLGHITELEKLKWINTHLLFKQPSSISKIS